MASLNQFISNVDSEIWLKSRSNTNNAEAAHSMVNREGKQLTLLSAILRYINLLIIWHYYIILLNNYKFSFYKEESNLINDVIKQLKSMINQEFHTLIVIEVKSKEHMNQ